MDVTHEITDLLDQLEHADEATRRVVRRLVALLLDVHGDGLARTVELLHERCDDPADVLGALVQDPLVGDLLLLHDLDPRSAAERVAAALASLGEAVPGGLGQVELVTAYDHEVRLRLTSPGEATAAGELAAVLTRAIAHAVPSAQILIEGAPRLLPVLRANPSGET